MKILIIGGTKFLGRHLIKAAQAKNYEVTLFNRGKFSAEKFANLEQINGDRNFDLEKLSNRTWDAVIDTCGYLPQNVKESAEFLRDSVGQYVFISSISAYADFSQPNFDENAPLAKLTVEQEKEFTKIDPKGELNGIVLGEMYGALKVLCEAAAERAMPDKVLNVRSGLIVGEHDWTDRFSYWVMRVARGGEVLAPANPNRFIQFIDGQDLAEWIVKAVENKTVGNFNLTGKPFELKFGRFLQEIKQTTDSDAEFIWVSEEFLTAENVAPWSEMPLFLPESDESFRGFLSANVDKALAEGLTFQPLRETILKTLVWRKTIESELKAGISVEKEKELLQKWRVQNVENSISNIK
jgi:2'-hydroxyisoflavone reductase